MKRSYLHHIAFILSTFTFVAIFLIIDISYCPVSTPISPNHENIEAIFSHPKASIYSDKKVEKETLNLQQKNISLFEKLKTYNWLQDHKIVATKFIPLHNCSWLL